MNSLYCSPCSPVARVPVIVTQEEEEDDDIDDDDCEIVENVCEKSNDDQSPVGVPVSQLPPAVRKLLSISCMGGRDEVRINNRFVADPLVSTKRRLFLTPKEKVSRQKGKATVTGVVPTVSPQVDKDSHYWRSIVGANRLKKDDSMLLLKMDALIAFLDNNFLCRHCFKSDSTVERRTIGFATSFTHRCTCGATARIKPDVTSINDEITSEQFND